MIVVNFKRYVSGDGAVSLARICKKYGAIACPQLADLAACVETGAECWTQKYEPLARGHTGTLLNHSDFRLDFKTIEETMLNLEGIKVCVCCKDVEEGIKISTFDPDWLAYEPPELIGNKEKSVSSEEPEDILRLVSSVQCPVLVGAGVHNAQDVKIALEMGAKGILVATDVVKAADPEKELRELAEVFVNKSKILNSKSQISTNV